MMKAWRVDFRDDCTIAYVLAETPGKAKRLAIKLEQDDSGESWSEYWTKIRVRREPRFDGEAITERQLILGRVMWEECLECGAMINGPGADEAASLPVFADGHAFCSDMCVRKRRERFGYLPAGAYVSVDRPRQGLCLYTQY